MARSKNKPQRRRTPPAADSGTGKQAVKSAANHKEKTQISVGTFFGVIGLVVLLGGLGLGLVLLRPANDQPAGSGSLTLQQGSGQSANLGAGENRTFPDKKTWQELDNAAEDGWETEAFNEAANSQLKKLGKLLTQPDDIDQAKLKKLISSDFTCGDLLPQDRSLVFQDQTIGVQRAKIANPRHDVFAGVDGLMTAIENLRRSYADTRSRRFKFKVIRVEPSESDVVTRQYLSISGKRNDGMIEQNATWVIRWADVGESLAKATPIIRSIAVESFEQVATNKSGGAPELFVDCTESALAGNESYKRQLLRGYNHWLERTETRTYWERLSTPGVAIGDVDGDGLDDLYLCQERGLPNLLFRQRADGSLEDISEQAGVNWLEDSRGALIADFDNDGDQDLAVGMSGGVLLAENVGNSKFEFRTVLESNDDVKTLCAADYDNDGWLDLYVTVYYTNVMDGAGKAEESAGVAAANATGQVLYDTNRGGQNSLFRNQIPTGNWSFEDVTESSGMNVNNARFSLAATWDDYDNDGDQDLYVANDYGRNCLYRNDAENGFQDVAGDAKVEDYNFAMSATWGDYNRDGWMDVYIGNMFSSAGNRVTTQSQFKEGATDEEIQRFKHLARGNTLFMNAGDGSFDDLSEDAGVTIGRWSWSTNFMDLNNDGWDDLVVANGMITTEDTGDC